MLAGADGGTLDWEPGHAAGDDPSGWRPVRPQVVTYRDGAHTRAFWDSVTLPAFAFVAGHLAA